MTESPAVVSIRDGLKRKRAAHSEQLDSTPLEPVRCDSARRGRPVASLAAWSVILPGEAR